MKPGLTMLALLVASPAMASEGGCFWAYPRNLPLPETNARYWRGDFELKAGERIEIEGAFPHARQMSFNLHRASDNAALASVTDVDIRPRPGHVNPFRAGARRDAKKRAYSVVVDPWRPANAGSIGASLPPAERFNGRLLFRMYLPDRAAPGGGEPLPRVWHVARDGSRHSLGHACPNPASVETAQTIGATRLPSAPGDVTDPLDWRGSATPAGTGSGDLLVNRDNAYAYTLTDYRRGDILVLEGAAPTHLKTLEGNRHMGVGEVRYWSICSYRHPSDRSAACLADELIPLDKTGRYTIVVSPPERRPANARSACNVAWLDALTATEGALLLRHVAPSTQFKNTPLNVAAGKDASTALAAYEPVGKYMSRTAFEGRGCRR